MQEPATEEVTSKWYPLGEVLITCRFLEDNRERCSKLTGGPVGDHLGEEREKKEKKSTREKKEVQ